MTLSEAIRAIAPPSDNAMVQARTRLNNMAKPLGSLGLLEDVIVQLAGASGSADIDISKRVVVAFCADNGVVQQGVTQCGQEVTAAVATNMGCGASMVCLMGRKIGMAVIPVDVGIAANCENVLCRKKAYGTQDFTQKPAMTREDAIFAIEVGISMAERCVKEGYTLLAAGEMGIGNTTTSVAVAGVLLNRDPSSLVGRGAGLSNDGLQKKIAAIKAGITLHKPNVNDPIDIISKVGGFDIAAMTGFYLGAAALRKPVMMDGLISSVAALCAVRMVPACAGYLIASHISAEPASILLLDALAKQPLICAGMRLGEGTGAVAAVALLDLALETYHHMASFADLSIEAYTPQE